MVCISAAPFEVREDSVDFFQYSKACVDDWNRRLLEVIERPPLQAECWIGSNETLMESVEINLRQFAVTVTLIDVRSIQKVDFSQHSNIHRNFDHFELINFCLIMNMLQLIEYRINLSLCLNVIEFKRSQLVFYDA